MLPITLALPLVENEIDHLMDNLDNLASITPTDEWEAAQLNDEIEHIENQLHALAVSRDALIDAAGAEADAYLDAAVA